MYIIYIVFDFNVYIRNTIYYNKNNYIIMKGLNRMENNNTSNELKNSKENTDNKKKKPRTSLALTDETKEKFYKLLRQYKCDIALNCRVLHFLC